MIIDIRDVLSCENKEVQKTVTIEMESFVSRLGEFPIVEKSPVTLQMTNKENERLFISGEVEVVMLIPCDRCLEEVPTTLHFEIDKEIPLENGTVRVASEEDDEEMDDTDYLIGFDLDVDKLIYREILVNWPMKVLCKEDCKGICKVCGHNLNKGECGCQRTELDPRMAAIQDVFNKFKEV